mgnify:CR=1 FL=1
MNITTIFAIERIKLGRLGNYILLSLMIVLNLAISLLLFYQFNSSENETVPIFDISRQILQAQSGIASILISIFIILNIGKEYQNGTLRKNLIDGYSRNDFYIGKLLILLTGVLLAFIIGIISLFLGSLIFHSLNDFANMISISFLINFLVEIFYDGLFALFLVVVSKKISLSLVFYFLWGMIEGIAVGIQSTYINNNEGETPFILLNEYLPKASLKLVLKLTDLVEPKAILITSVYIFLFTFLPYFLFRKSDIKS